MPQYAVLLYSPAPADVAEMPPEELAAHEAHGAEIERLGATVLSGYALDSSRHARFVRGSTVSGPAEAGTGDVLAGFMVIEARDTDHAVQVAKRNPARVRGAVEVRPLL
ncbi:hypothetical protein FB561_6915 [Kribbella amoyensis]|uniref:YCII-related domain-containing protein n=1 Tax=Kribbella amoyensis TaxID=996641 RepID=A0A561B2E8_9ACTN|nr:YciI family protein [Kribbella amoyensis]TWD73030.1 hypothetical protein FB561_6915 [Kribbella amoyensis]